MQREVITNGTDSKRRQKNGAATAAAQVSNGRSHGGWKSSFPARENDQQGENVAYTSGWSIIPPFLVLVCPAFAMVMSYTIVKLDGVPSNLLNAIIEDGLFATVYKAWIPYIFGSWEAWKLIVPYAIFQLILMKILPGKVTKGPVTPTGNVPIYKANGMLAYAVTLVAFFVSAYILKLFNPAEVYDHFLEIIGAMNLVSLIFCLGLLLKGRYFPSSSDSGCSGSFVFDYYWGTELYPRVLDFDVKMFTNCRFGMMSWPLLILCYAAKQYESHGLSDSMIVAVGIQLIYLTKFFHWEMGYMKTLDIMHDRAGFYLCWGCLVWVPSIYTSHTLYLTNHPNNLGLPLALMIFITGTCAVLVNYDIDRQKESFRNHKGKCTIWGRQPEVIEATYQTSSGERKMSLLLASGWWGVARHFHYIPELIAALTWTLPALFHSVVPYFYFVFLLILLTHRSVRDDWRCLEKYGKYWRLYCDKVPYRILPFVF